MPQLNYIRLNCAELLVACDYIPPARIGKLVKGLARAATFDSWDYDRGIPLITGDFAFKPKTDKEKIYWAKQRHEQRECFKKLVQRSTVNRISGAKGGTSTQRIRKEPPRQTADIIRNLSNCLHANREPGIFIEHNFDIGTLRGNFATFLFRKFSAYTLEQLSRWLRNHYTGRSVSTQTLIKTACKIQKVDYNTVMAELLRET